eukprot:g18628.t1
MQSGRISNDRNPVWNHQETKRVFSGAFEAEMKDPPHGWGAKAGQMLSTRSRTRKRQEDAQLAAVRRFGADGLKISFGSKPDAEKLGTNHEVARAVQLVASGEAYSSMCKGMQVLEGEGHSRDCAVRAQVCRRGSWK